jgi:hypothetical protein
MHRYRTAALGAVTLAGLAFGLSYLAVPATAIAVTVGAVPLVAPAGDGSDVVLVRGRRGGHGQRGHRAKRSKWKVHRHFNRRRAGHRHAKRHRQRRASIRISRPYNYSLPSSSYGFSLPRSSYAFPEFHPPKQAAAAVSRATSEPASPPNRLGCDAASGIVAGYAFSDVTPVTCSGSSYRFEAMRENRAYSITLDASNGELMDVERLADATPP